MPVGPESPPVLTVGDETPGGSRQSRGTATPTFVPSESELMNARCNPLETPKGDFQAPASIEDTGSHQSSESTSSFTPDEDNEREWETRDEAWQNAISNGEVSEVGAQRRKASRLRLQQAQHDRDKLRHKLKVRTEKK